MKNLLKNIFQAYNYNLLPGDCRSNSSLESYNKYLKDNLGNKTNLCWLNFINFIKNEIERNQNKVINNCNINLKHSKKRNNKLKNLEIKNLDNDKKKIIY